MHSSFDTDMSYLSKQDIMVSVKDFHHIQVYVNGSGPIKIFLLTLETVQLAMVTLFLD